MNIKELGAIANASLTSSLFHLRQLNVDTDWR